MTIHIYFVKLDDVHVLQYCFSLPSRQKGHIMFRCIPLVVDAKELTYENPARSDRARHAFKHLAKTALGEKRERKLGIDEIVGLERKILERSLDDLQVPLGKAAQNGDRVRIAIDRCHTKSLLQQIERVSARSSTEIKGAAFVRQ